MAFQKPPDKLYIETINILLYYFKHIYMNERRMMLENKYNHSIDFKKGKINACKYPHAWLDSPLFTRDCILKHWRSFTLYIKWVN